MKAKTLISTLAALICLMAPTAVQAQVKDRGLDLSSMPAFTQKGKWMTGGTASWSVYDDDNAKLLVINGLTTNGYLLNVSPAFCYMIRDNMGVGVRLGYSRNMVKLDSASVNISSLGMSVSDYHTLDHTFQGQVILRNYIPIGSSKRIALYNEAQIGFKYGQSKIVNGNSGIYEGSYDKTKSVGLNLCPGIVAFANDHWAVDVSVNMLGLNYVQKDQTRNQVYKGSQTATSVSFQVNILAIGFGLYYYL